MFVAQAKYNEIVQKNSELETEKNTLSSEKEALTAQVTSLTSEKETLTAQATTLTSEKEALTTQVTSLTSEKEALTAQVTTLSSEKEALTKENEELKKLPGADHVRSKSDTEHSTDSKTKLDQLNDFCDKNSGDVNACLNAINKFFN